MGEVYLDDLTILITHYTYIVESSKIVILCELYPCLVLPKNTNFELRRTKYLDHL